MKTKEIILIFTIATLLLTGSMASASFQSPEPPNIGLIMADDLGFSDNGASAEQYVRGDGHHRDVPHAT